MKNIIELFVPKVFAADCDATAGKDGYGGCCIGKANEVDALELELKMAEMDGDTAQANTLKPKIAAADTIYREQCGDFLNITPVGEEKCQQLYGEFFVTAGEGNFADMCMCDDRTTENIEFQDCKKIPVASFTKDCTDKGGTYTNGVCDVCAFGLATDGTCVANTQGTLGIECSDPTKPCSLNTSQLFRSTGVASGTETKSLLVRFQDITLAATGFIGTVLTVSLIVVALRYIAGGVDEGYVGNAKKAFQYAIIGFFLVAFSYTIIRLVQFLAKGG